MDSSTVVERIEAQVGAVGEQLLAWATSPAGWAQAAMVVAAVVLSPLVARMLRARLAWLREPPGPDAVFRAVVFKVAPFLRALVLVGLLMAGGAAADAAFGSSVLVRTALGFAMVFALYRAIRTLVPARMQRPALLVGIPIALLAAAGVLGSITGWLDTNYAFDLLGTTFTPTKILRVLFLGALLFWVGGVFNTRGQDAIRSQEGMDVGLREIVAKVFQILIFVVLFVMLFGVAGIPLGSIIVVFSALTLGIGLGLQGVAANFVSGLIILLDRSVRIGDYVELDDGRAGNVSAINMRSTTVETFDGKDILVPNLTFIENTYLNWTHTDPSQRYEVGFTVDYDTDLDALEGIIMPAVLAYEKLLTDPEEPDLELRAFGDHGIEMALEFWADGIDDGANKFTSDVGFIIWRALRDAGVRMAFHQLVIREAPAAATRVRA